MRWKARDWYVDGEREMDSIQHMCCCLGGIYNISFVC